MSFDMVPPGENEIDTFKTSENVHYKEHMTYPFLQSENKNLLVRLARDNVPPCINENILVLPLLVRCKKNHKYHSWKGSTSCRNGTPSEHEPAMRQTDRGSKQYVCHIWLLLCTQTHTQSSLVLKFRLTVLPPSAMYERSVAVRRGWSKIMAGNIALGIKEVPHEHSGDESDDDVDDVVEQSPCGRWEKRRQEVIVKQFFELKLIRGRTYICFKVPIAFLCQN